MTRDSHFSRQEPGVFHRAAALLQEKHHVTRMGAYEMLVNGAVEAGRSVRETATAIVGEVHETH